MTTDNIYSSSWPNTEIETVIVPEPPKSQAIRPVLKGVSMVVSSALNLGNGRIQTPSNCSCSRYTDSVGAPVNAVTIYPIVTLSNCVRSNAPELPETGTVKV